MYITIGYTTVALCTICLGGQSPEANGNHHVCVYVCVFVCVCVILSIYRRSRQWLQSKLKQYVSTTRVLRVSSFNWLDFRVQVLVFKLWCDLLILTAVLGNPESSEE